MVVDEVREYFTHKFASGPTSLPGPFPWDSDSFSMAELPTIEEVQWHVGKMKLHKTSGVSGISADLLHALLEIPQGHLLLLQVVHGILIGSHKHYQGLYDGPSSSRL